jgi:hypothetical protein
MLKIDENGVKVKKNSLLFWLPLEIQPEEGSALDMGQNVSYVKG